MRTLFLAFLLIFAVIKPVYAMEQDAIPVVCDTTKVVLSQLKNKTYQPVIIGELENVQTAIFLNETHEMVVAVTVKLQGKWTTCIFIGGDENTKILDAPKRQNNNEQDG